MDPRVARTRRRLQEALFDLAKERGIAELSVSDVAERAGVNRSTFYQHYSDLDTVLADALDSSAALAGAQLDKFLVLGPQTPEPLVTFLCHIYDNAPVYRQAFSGARAGSVLARLQAHIRGAIDHVSITATSEAPPAIPLDIIAAGVTGSIVGVIAEWLATDPLAPPEEAAAWAWSLILGPPDIAGAQCR